MEKGTINKTKSRKETAADQIRGFELQLDPSVKQICEVYNSTSGSTRTVIYVLLIVNVISLIAALNTNPWNWTKSRLANADAEITNAEMTRIISPQNYSKNESQLKQDAIIKDKLRKQNVVNYNLRQVQKDSANRHTDYLLKKLRDSDKLEQKLQLKEDLIRSKIHNSDRVAIPLMGNSFDIDDLSLISGATFITLLIMLRFTLAREKDNLKIALLAIAERYFKHEIEKDYSIAIAGYKPKGMDVIEFAALVNFKMRRYHYNSLSMSEIFNLPMLDVSKDKLQGSIIGDYVKNHLFYFPNVVYFLIMVNDFATIMKGIEVAPVHTVVSCLLSLSCLFLIVSLTYSCNRQKQIINFWFDKFFKDDYIVERADYIIAPNLGWSKMDKRYYYPGYLITKLEKRIKGIKKRKHGIG